MAGLFRSVALGEIPRDDFDRELVQKSLTLVYLGIGSFVATYLSTVGFMIMGERLTRAIRANYLRGLLKQNMAFFDNTGPGVLSSRIAVDCQTIQDGISERVAFVITSIATLASAYVIGFIRYWKLTLVASAVVVVMLVASTVSARFMIRCTRESIANYSLAGGMAEEVISSIRTVKTLGARETFASRFESHLANVERWGRRTQLIIACMIAVLLTTTSMSHALTFWTGSIFVASGEASVSDVITVAFAILIGSHQLGPVASHFRIFGGSIAAASKVFSVIDRPSPLDPTSKEGRELDRVSGSIELCGVTHVYPSRPKQVVMNNIDLSIPAGKTTAVVGPSGSGKSTIIGLIERFYMPVGGKVLLDGHDISTLNLRWLRQRIGLVGQEPVLFGSTIFENIAVGLTDPESPKSVEDRVYEAAKRANAHDFIVKLPHGYDTKLGEGGSQLSGGQKQRIAIARALVRDPDVLLLDEATSALDAESEQTVREAIRSASVGRTTVIVSHRLSSITDADNIIVLSEGRVAERGTHQDLQKQGGIYADLFRSQHKGKRHDEEEAEKVEVAANIASNPVRRAPVNTAGERQKEASLWSLIKLTASFNRPEAKLLALGLFFSILAGCVGPTLAFLLAKAINELSKPESMVESMRAGANFWCLMMFVVGLVQLLNLTIQGVSFAICSERLVYRARSTLFRAILAKDVVFFDRDENRTGALTAPLGLEAKSLSGVSGSTLGTILMSCTTLIASMAIALAIGWKVALVCMSTIPVLLGCGFYRVWMIAKFAQRSHQAQRVASAFASEAVMSVRTIASLASERQTADEYERQLRDQEHKSFVSISKSSVPYAASQSFSFFCVALAFWYGGQRIADREYTIFQFFLCFAEIIFGAQSAGMVFSFATDIGRAKKAAATFHSMLRNELVIDDQTGVKPETFQGKVEFDNIYFTYPNRPETSILNGFKLTVQPGQNIALVGSSGCGKSTCFALLERLYDADEGVVKLDGQDIRSLDVGVYRGSLAYVSQEPTVYSGTIRDNIALGCAPGQEASDEEIVQACKDSNIYDFISSLS